MRFVRIVMGRASSIYAAHEFLGILVGGPNRLCTDRGASVVRPSGELDAQLNAIGLSAALRR